MARMLKTFDSYMGAYGILQRARGKEMEDKDVKMAPNTRMYLIGKKYGDPIGINLYRTRIITIYDNGTWALSSGGYHTKTTQDRINKLSPANVGSKKGTWYLWPHSESPVEFYDGIKINSAGMPILPYSGYAATGRKPKTFKGSKRRK